MMNFDLWRHFYRARFFLLIKQPDKAMLAYRQALAVDAEFIQALDGIGMLLAARHDYRQAADYFRASLQLKPGSAFVHFNLGFVLEKLGNRGEAIAAFQQAVAINPALDRAWYGMGLAHATLGQHAAAAEAFRHAAELQPMNPHAWYNLGMAYHTLHDPDKVKEVIRHLHRFDPKMSRQLIVDAGRSDLSHLINT